MWVILKESRHFYNNIKTSKCPTFNAMCNHLKGQMPFSIVGLPEGLLEPKSPKDPKTKKCRIDDDKDLKPAIDLTDGSPIVKQKIKKERNPIIIDKLGSTLAKANRNNVGLRKICDLCGVKIWDVFPEYCGYTTIYGKCNKAACPFKHEMAPDDVAKKIVSKLQKVIDDSTLITGKSHSA